MTTANPFNKISATCFCEIMTYIFGDIFDQDGKHWLNNKSTEDQYYVIYKRINYNYNYDKYDKKWIYKFRDLIEKKKCELIGSGLQQIISPSCPEKITKLNLQIQWEHLVRFALKITLLLYGI